MNFRVPFQSGLTYTQRKPHFYSSARDSITRYAGWSIGPLVGLLFGRRHATLHLAMLVGRLVGALVGNVFEFRAVFALLLLPNRPRLDCRVSGLVFSLAHIM